MEKETLMSPSDLLEGHRMPWLARKEWRERRIVSHGARGCFFALAIPFFGLPALVCFIGALITVFRNPVEAAGALFVGTIFGGALAGVNLSAAFFVPIFET